MTLRVKDKIEGTITNADKLATARTISLTGSVTGSGSFDGSNNLSIATSTNHSHSYLPLSGGTMTGAIIHNAKNNQFTSTGGSWISGKTQSNCPIAFTTSITKDGSRYDPYIWGKNTDGDVWNFGGGAANTVGFWGFKSSRTSNGTDWGFTINVTNGAVNSSGNITAPTFVGNLSGNASTATALTTSAGSATQPVYFSSGKPVACTYTLGKSVPSNAVFTDTNTKVTQSETTTGNYRPLLFGATSNSDTTKLNVSITDQSYVSNKFYAQPSTGTLVATTFKGALSGNATTATTASNLSGFKITTTTNLGVDSKDVNQAIGYVSGLTKAAWNGNQVDGALYRQCYSGSWIHQIFGDYRTGQLAVRGLANNTWTAWRTVLDSTNYTSYAPTKTGSGASGTWGINVTGSSASCTGNAATATSAGKLTTARTIGLGMYSDGSASFDGSGNITINDYGYGAAKYVTTDSTATPYWRIAYTSTTSSWNDMDMLIAVSSNYNGGGFGILKVSFRTDNIGSGANGSASVKWLVRYGYALDQFIVKYYLAKSATCYADLYFKANSSYQDVNVRVLTSGGRGSRSRAWTFDSGSSRANPDIRTYTGTATSTDAGSVSSASTATKLATARTISLTGSVTGSGSFDGSGNLSISTSTNHTHSQYYDSGVSRTKNTVLAAPNGSNGSATFRALVAADIPSLAASKITSGTFDAARIPSLSTDKLTSGTLPVARGGTGAVSLTGTSGLMHNMFDNNITNAGYVPVFTTNWADGGYMSCAQLRTAIGVTSGTSAPPASGSAGAIYIQYA